MLLLCMCVFVLVFVCVYVCVCGVFVCLCGGEKTRRRYSWRRSNCIEVYGDSLLIIFPFGRAANFYVEESFTFLFISEDKKRISLSTTVIATFLSQKVSRN